MSSPRYKIYFTEFPIPFLLHHSDGYGFHHPAGGDDYAGHLLRGDMCEVRRHLRCFDEGLRFGLDMRADPQWGG